MWAYLSLGPTLPLPEGLEPPKGLIVAVKDRPSLLRTFMPEAGSRAIAVGYPGGVSVAFDATQCRLAYGWSGSFLDATPVWANRGGAPAKLLGTKFWGSPQGFPWGLSSKTPPDFAAIARDPAFGAGMAEGKLFQGDKQLFFEGYQFDASGLPAFTYHLGSAKTKAVTIVERPAPVRASGAIGVTRNIDIRNGTGTDLWLNTATVGGANGKLRLMDAQGKETGVDLKDGVEFSAREQFILVPQEGGRILVIGATAAAAAQWHLQFQGGSWQILLRLGGDVATTSLALRIWTVSRDEPALLREVIGAH